MCNDVASRFNIGKTFDCLSVYRHRHHAKLQSARKEGVVIASVAIRPILGHSTHEDVMSEPLKGRSPCLACIRAQRR